MDMKEAMGKKKAIDPSKKDAKLKVLKEMRQVASDMMSPDIKDHMSKVTVAAKNPADLKKGLSKAEDLLEGADPALEEAEEMSHQDLDNDMEQDEPMAHKLKVLSGSEGNSLNMDAPRHDEIVDQIQDPEELDMLMQKLMEKKKEMMKA